MPNARDLSNRAVELAEQSLSTSLPAGTTYAWTGEARDLREANTEVWWIFGLALIIVYMTLAAQFESLIHPFTVILAVPLALIGAFGSLLLLHQLGLAGTIPALPSMNWNLFSQVGVVLLLGLVTKNSILLVEYANQQADKGVDPVEAMVQAGLVRLRPILMTKLTCVGGLVPLLLFGGPLWHGLAVVIIGGLSLGTLVTLGLVPVLYSCLFGEAESVTLVSSDFKTASVQR